MSYELRVEWTVDGFGTTHARRITGRPGEKVIADFAR
jgi:hypothetical protein